MLPLIIIAYMMQVQASKQETFLGFVRMCTSGYTATSALSKGKTDLCLPNWAIPDTEWQLIIIEDVEAED